MLLRLTMGQNPASPRAEAIFEPTSPAAWRTKSRGRLRTGEVDRRCESSYVGAGCGGRDWVGCIALRCCSGRGWGLRLLPMAWVFTKRRPRVGIAGHKGQARLIDIPLCSGFTAVTFQGQVALQRCLAAFRPGRYWAPGLSGNRSKPMQASAFE